MTDPLMQWPSLLFMGMMAAFLATILFCTLTDKSSE